MLNELHLYIVLLMDEFYRKK